MRNKGFFKSIRIRGGFLSIFLFGILITYNNCSFLGHKLEKISIPVGQVILKEKRFKLPISDTSSSVFFEVKKLDDKYFSISDVKLFPHTNAYEYILFRQEKSSLLIPLQKGRLGDLEKNAFLFKVPKGKETVQVNIK